MAHDVLHLDGKLMLVAIAVTPIIGVLARIYRIRLRRRSREVPKVESEAHRLGTLQGCNFLLQIEPGGRAVMSRNGATAEHGALALGGVQAEPGADAPRR